jgi:CheY-like chemotaxis protein
LQLATKIEEEPNGRDSNVNFIEVSQNSDVVSHISFVDDQSHIQSQKSLINDTRSEGKIIIADDMLINIEVLKCQFRDLNLMQRCEFYTDGHEAYGAIEETIATYVSCIADKKQSVHKPISLVLIDFQMPKLNGLEVYLKTKNYIEFTNERNPSVQVECPKFVVVTSFSTPNMRNYLT